MSVSIRVPTEHAVEQIEIDPMREIRVSIRVPTEHVVEPTPLQPDVK